MARYDEPRGGGWRGGDRFPRGREMTPYPEQTPPHYRGGEWDRGYGAPPGPRRGAYSGDFVRGRDVGPPRGWRVGPYATPPRHPEGLVGGRHGEPRGVYGAAYEQFGGRVERGWRGDAYGGRESHGRGYDAGFAREPFIPEEAYRRHPEYRQPHQPREWEAFQHDPGEEMSDEEVRGAVYRRMSADAWLDAGRIDVRVDDGVVTLTGEVDDYLKARYAWDDAWESDGVRGVVNNLTVRADQPRPAHGDVLPQSGGARSKPDETGLG